MNFNFNIWYITETCILKKIVVSVIESLISSGKENIVRHLSVTDTEEIIYML